MTTPRRDFDSITQEDLRNAGSLKWTLYPDTIGMFVAEMDFGVSPAIGKLLTDYVNGSGIGYRSGAQAEATKQATADWYAEHTGWQISPTSIRLVPDVVSAARIAITELTPHGSAVVLPTPAYMAFRTLVPELDRPLVEVPSPVKDGKYVLDLAGIDRALADGARIVLLVNPWNPVGRVLSREELEALDAVMAKYPEARVFSDEIHAPLVLEGKHIPYASTSENAARQTITAISATKGWNIPGVKSAQVIVNDADADKLSKTLAWFDSMTSTLGSQATTAAYRDTNWITDVRSYLRANRDLVYTWAQGTPGVEMLPVEGTYIAWLDFSGARAAGKVPQGVDVAEWLRDFNVALTPGHASGHGYADFARMIFATPRPILEEALARLSRALS